MTVKQFLLKKFPTKDYFDCPISKEYWETIQEFADQELDQERLNHNNTRIAWDITCRERDELKAIVTEEDFYVKGYNAGLMANKILHDSEIEKAHAYCNHLEENWTCQKSVDRIKELEGELDMATYEREKARQAAEMSLKTSKRRREENERLNFLLYDQFWRVRRLFDVTEDDIKDQWQKFKIENQIP